jgi:hypothetical protein
LRTSSKEVVIAEFVYFVTRNSRLDCPAYVVWESGEEMNP